MSIESAKAFIQKVKSDEEFKTKLGAIKDGQARMNFAKAAGFDFTADEIAKVKAEQGLTDEELDSVAGGCGHLCLKDVGDLSVW
ncbi:MAG TPA: Nif11-like leader peptide family natural product precursor [Bacillota bacterium]|nr:Nif11-like leader peptide family natural product precursor [Bacillota bacterium]HPL53221.1 Nif11-like leader peptide family natural product precursor [Bacillota bacterium]